MDATDEKPERLTLLLLLATFLFVGALRAFLSSVYYENLAALELNATALYALLLLAPVLFLVPAARRRPRALLLVGALGLALGRLALAPTRGTPLHLPLAGIAAASWLVLLGALLPSLRGARAAHAGAGVALGWALDVALVWYGDSADPTQGLRGLLLVAPAAVLLVLAALGRPRDAHATSEPARVGWLAGAALGAWLFLEHVVFGNPFGTARWNEADPTLVAAASVAGLLAGAILAGRLDRRALVILHALALVGALDHALFHSPLVPLGVLVAQATLALDAALLLGALGDGRPLLLAGLVALVLHFVFAFTYLFAYVPLGALWEGRASVVLLAGALLALAPAAMLHAPRVRTNVLRLAGVPALVAVVALVTPAAAIHAPDDDGALRVMTFNLHQGFANDGVVDADIFLQILREEDPDIVVLQESDSARFTSGNVDIAGLLATRGGYHLAYGQPMREQAFGGAILSRHPIHEWRAIALPSESDDRFYTEARLDVHGQDVWVYAVHLTLPRADRLAQDASLYARVMTREGPIILAGDLNSCPNGLCTDDAKDGVARDDVYDQMAMRFQDAWVAAGNDRDDPAGFTYEATDPRERIDYIFVSPGIEVLGVERVRSEAVIRASDHMPVRADLRLP